MSSLTEETFEGNAKTMAFDAAGIQKLLRFAAQNKVSDIHFRVGSPPTFRIQGELVQVSVPALTDADLGALTHSLLNDAQKQRFAGAFELDGSYDLPGVCRFRFNLFRHDGKVAAVLRLIPLEIPTMESLGLPPVFKKIAEMERGFVLVTGATGQGKSTTLAALIHYLNSRQAVHIVTIEDPVEFVHPQMKAKVTQREVGRDTRSFADALRSALRQDPDVILVGEMRDTETIDIALKAAETGHLVLSTVHTTDAAKTVGRLVSMFPSDEQAMVRLRLADCLKATVSQRLLTPASGKGRALTLEIMLVNTAIQECIADASKTASIPQFIENSKDILGGQTFDQHLLELLRSGVITLETAKRASVNASDFERNLNFSDAANSKQGTSSMSAPLEFTHSMTGATTKKAG